MTHISLSGTWDFRLDEDTAWRPIPVPGCWEMLGIRKDHAGPAWYRRSFVVPAEFAGKRVWLRFGAVSYHCEIVVNGRAVGSHTGLWDTFAVEVTGAASPGESAELLVRVEKPASLERGPDSAPLPGRFPLRETLSGFLPYVWGQIFGGIWQDVELIATGQVIVEDAHVQGTADGRVQVEAALSGAATVTLELYDPDGTQVFVATAETIASPKEHRSSAISSASYRAHFAATLPNPQPWSPQHPARYRAILRVEDGDERVIRFGLRSLHVDGTTIVLNGRPIYPRMALSWGWYPEALHSNPTPERVRADFARLRSLGYNGVKLCLWFPPQHYFDLADELGMLLWVELPIWLPEPTAYFRRQTLVEYERLARLARGHPSAILYSLGCELNRAVGADLLAPLYKLVKQHAGDALVRDNSGSGEAYGGLLNEFAEYYDYHFYSELQFFRGLIDYFTPRWRPVQPWVFGEFCESDTFRDLRKLQVAGCRSQISEPNLQSAICNLQSPPWWTIADPEQNPQGARWLYHITEQEQRLRANGLWERGEELEQISKQQALFHRKFILELVRTYREISGYVVSGERDTPIGTTGMWDDLDQLKFDPAAFQAFNNDLVVLVGWDRRRAWLGGGDRAAPWDTWSYPAGALVRPHLIASHYGATTGPARLAWNVAFPGEPPFAVGESTTSFALDPGSLREIAVAEFSAPMVEKPRQAILRASLQIGEEAAENQWPLWFFPQSSWRGAARVALVDPTGRLRDLREIALAIGNSPTGSTVALATDWTTEIQSFVAAGGSAVLLQAGSSAAGPLPTVEAPFWRETIRLLAPHPAWRDFPLDDAAGMQFFGCATDHALDLSSFDGSAAPILRRLDARTMRLHEYAVELSWGAGRLIVTTLRFEGGHGSQPFGIARNTAAAHLLWCWVQYLLDGD